jgi:FAD/FMN-containing dehydrogenase
MGERLLVSEGLIMSNSSRCAISTRCDLQEKQRIVHQRHCPSETARISGKRFAMGSVSHMHPLVAELLQQGKLAVFIPSSPSWADVRATYIVDNPAQPLAIARPRNADEVCDLVKAARAYKVKITVRVGGHDVFGRSIGDGCLVLDLRDLKAIEIAEDGKSATIGGGTLIGDTVAKLSTRKLVTPFGYFPSIGYVGWAICGGYGLLTSSLGLGVDQILRARVVTAEGNIVEADAELLKGIRGAGGNFGVVVEVGIKTYPMEKVSSV